MRTNFSEVVRVVHALESLSIRIEGLIHSNKSGRLDHEALMKRTAELKAYIKAANKYGTIEGTRLPASEIELMYYRKAIQDASSNFTLRADVSPKNLKWESGLNAVKNEIIYHLSRLQRDYPLA